MNYCSIFSKADFVKSLRFFSSCKKILGAFIFVFMAIQLNLNAQCELICPENMSFTLGSGECNRIVTYDTPTFSDNCTGTASITGFVGLPSGELFPVGTTIVTYNYTTDGSDFKTCAFSITINSLPNSRQDVQCKEGIICLVWEETASFLQVKAGDILEGGNYDCFDNYIVQVSSEGTDRQSSFTNRAAELGKFYDVKVFAPSGSTCTAVIYLMASGTTCPVPSTLTFGQPTGGGGTPLTFSDPCSCSDGANCDDTAGGNYYFHDVLRIPAAGDPPLATGQDIRFVSAMDFYISTPCQGGAANLPSFGAAGTAIPETSPGVYEIDFWRLSGVAPTNVSVLHAGTTTPVPAATFLPICQESDCPEPIVLAPIPTMSQWGLMIFGLLLLNLGIYFVRRQELVL